MIGVHFMTVPKDPFTRKIGLNIVGTWLLYVNLLVHDPVSSNGHIKPKSVTEFHDVFE